MTAPAPEAHFLGDPLALARAIRDGDLATVQARAPHTDLNTPGAQGITLLAYALMAASDRDPQRLAIVSALVRAGADVHQPVADMGSLWGAVLLMPDPAFAAAFLDGGVTVDARVGGYTPPLSYCAMERSAAVMRMLLARGADLDGRDTLGTPAITHALRAMELDVVEELLARGADGHAVNLRGESFLWVLQQIHGRQREGSRARMKLEAIRDALLATGRFAWPPADPATEREALRDAGVEPIVPIGHTR